MDLATQFTSALLQIFQQLCKERTRSTQLRGPPYRSDRVGTGRLERAGMVITELCERLRENAEVEER